MAQVAGPQTEPVVDYTGVLQVLGSGRQADLSHRRVMAGVVRLAQTSQGWANLVKFHWVKAHQDLAVAEKGSEAWLDILGNFLADVKAKEAVLQHPPAQGGEMDRAQSDGERMTRWLQYVGKAVVLWPGHAKFKKLPKRHRQKELAARAAVVHDRLQTAVGDQAHQHDWQWRASASRWVCSKCLRHTTVRHKFRTGCAGLAKKILQVFDTALGHTLVAFDMEPGFILCCSACGGWCDQHPKDLLKECRRGMTRGARCDAKALLAGTHPRIKTIRRGPPVPIGNTVVVDPLFLGLNSDQNPGVGLPGSRSAGKGRGGGACSTHLAGGSR